MKKKKASQPEVVQYELTLFQKLVNRTSVSQDSTVVVNREWLQLASQAWDRFKKLRCLCQRTPLSAPRKMGVTCGCAHTRRLWARPYRPIRTNHLRCDAVGNPSSRAGWVGTTTTNSLGVP
jgi:hypothetical protein